MSEYILKVFLIANITMPIWVTNRNSIVYILIYFRTKGLLTTYMSRLIIVKEYFELLSMDWRNVDSI